MAYKKIIFFFLLSTITLAYIGCNDDDNNSGEGSVELLFKGKYGDRLLTMFEDTYAYEDGIDLKFQLFQFYISDITLLKEDGEEVLLKDVDMVSFKDIFNQSDAADGVSLSLGEWPAGNYKGIKFGLGVNETMNATQPSDYDLDHPLTASNYWSWASGYVFTKIEGNADLNNDGEFEEKLTFHIGRNDYYRNMSFEQNLEITSDETNIITFDVDIQKVLTNPSSGAYIDFRTVTQDHTTNPEVAGFVADQLMEAIQIQ